MIRKDTMSNTKRILWLDTPSTTTRLKIGKEILIDELRVCQIVIWNRAGMLRYFPQGLVTNLRNQYDDFLDRPTKQTSMSPDALSLTWGQALAIEERIQMQLKRMITI